MKVNSAGPYNGWESAVEVNATLLLQIKGEKNTYGQVKVPLSRTPHLQLLLSHSVVAPVDCLFSAALSVTLWKCVKVKQGKADKEYICLFCLNLQ